MRPPQLPLALALPDHATFETFEPGENVLVLKALERFLDARGERLWLWGSPGAGKSHLLQAACQRVLGSQWLPGALVKEAPEAVLAGLEQVPLVALDEVDLLAGDRAAEEALFDLCNRLQAAGRALLLAASGAPLSHSWSLPDLASRLAAASVFRLQPLDDDGRARALQRRAEARGLSLAEATARYILHRIPRDPASLFAFLDRLDEAALQSQRRITIPFVREALGS